MSTATRLADFISESITYDRASETIGADEPLIDGLLDSTDILRLVVFVEDEFKIRIEDDELVPENFQSIRTLSEFIDRKRKGDSDERP